MQLLNVKISQRNSYFISPELVHAANVLAKDGEQRLRPVSTREDSTFYFWLASTCNAHLAAVRVSISIVASVSRPSNPFYEPAAQIIPCCDESDLAGFQKAAQRIYDVYIRPIQWTLDLDIPSSYTSAPDPTCWERGQRALERLVYDSEREIRDDNTTTSRDTPSGDAHGRAPQDRIETEEVQQVGTSDGRDGNTTGGNEWSQSTQPKPNQKKSLSVKETEDQDKMIVKTLAKKALNQLDIIYVRASTSRRRDVTYRLEVKAIIDRYQQAQPEDRFSALDALRARLWEGGEDHEVEVKLEDNAVLAPNVVKWARKLCSSCILFMLREQRKIQATNTQRYWADGTSIIHSVLNDLFVAEGPKALGVLAALSELNHGLSIASKKGKSRQVRMSELLTDALRGKLKCLPGRYLLPFPPVFLAWVTDQSVTTICRSLGLSNLAILDLEPRDSLFIELTEVVDKWAVASGSEKDEATQFLSINIDQHHRGEPTTSSRSAKRRKTQRAETDGLHGGQSGMSKDGLAIQDALRLEPTADNHPMLQISQTPARAARATDALTTYEDGLSSLGVWSGLSLSQHNPPVGVLNEPIQPTTGICFDSSGNVSLPDGSSVPNETLTSLNLLLEAAAQQDQPVLTDMDHQAVNPATSAAVGAFVQTGDRSAMLGVPHLSNVPSERAMDGSSYHGTDTGWEGETDMDAFMGIEEPLLIERWPTEYTSATGGT